MKKQYETPELGVFPWVADFLITSGEDKERVWGPINRFTPKS